MINGNKLIANCLNFVIAICILTVGMFCLEVPTAENIFQLAQHVIGMILIWFGLDFNMFKGE